MTKRALRRYSVFGAAAAALLAVTAPGLGCRIVGLITKTETNPFFVKMREGAQAEGRRARPQALITCCRQVRRRQ